MTIFDLLDEYKDSRDFNKRIGPLINKMLVAELVEYFENPALGPELMQCNNLNQHMNVIEQRTKALSIHRTDADISKFRKNIERLFKMARL